MHQHAERVRPGRRLRCAVTRRDVQRCSERSGSADHDQAVGVSGSFSGATAFYGQEAEKGAQVAIDELNGANGAFKFEYVKADDECTPEGGASAYGSLIDVENVDVILGSPCSGAVLGAVSLLPDAKVPNVVVSATNPAITAGAGVGGNDFVWRVNISDAVMAKVWSKYIADQGIKKIATIAVNNDFGRGAVTAYKAEFANNGLEPVAEVVLHSGRR